MPHFFNPRQTHIEQRKSDFSNIKKAGVNLEKLTNIYRSSQYSNVAISYRDIEEESKDMYGGNERLFTDGKP